MDNSIFREYDIRGIAGKDLNDEVVEMIGLAFGSTIVENGLKKISIGRDCRKSSDWIFDSLSKGIVKTGVDVVDLGLVTTPVLYFSLHGLDVDGGIMITASHNPKEYNGFKVYWESGNQLVPPHDKQVIKFYNKIFNLCR